MKTHYKIEFLFGAEHDRDNKLISRDDRSHALQQIRREAAQIFGGYTLVYSFGGWTDDNGTLVEEEGRKLFVLVPFVFDHRIAQLAGIIKASLNQAFVYVTINEVELKEF